MGTFTSEVEICNSALIKVGRDTITSLSDDSERARIVNARYALVRDELLRGHPWNFALARVELADTGNTPVFDYAHEFQIPSDVLRILKTDLNTIPPSSDKRVTTTFGSDLPAWKIEGDKLITDEGSISILYIKRITDVGLFPSDFGEVLALRLALDIAYRMTSDLNLIATLTSAYKDLLALARAFDAQESDNERVTTSDWLNTRL